MRVIRKNLAIPFRNSDSCTAFEYGLDDKDLGAVAVEVSGRYPDKGRAVNRKCKQTAYILKGKGKIFLEDNEVEFGEGDLILIDRGEKYHWDGNFTALLSSSPAWHGEQYENVE